jgi:Glycosyl transferase 4-like domain
VLQILIVSPHFPPVNTADLHRVRLLLPHMQEQGWAAEVLAVEPAQIASPLDEWLLGGLPPKVLVHRVKALSLSWSKVPGFGTLGFRSLLALAKAGDRLLADKHFDLIYFSTTVFEVHILGAYWKQRFGVPFVIDYQDPWVNDYYQKHPEIVPPGGRLKYKVIDTIHRCMEPFVIKACAGITAVSPAYPKQIDLRYPFFSHKPRLILPFPGSSEDFERVKIQAPQQTFFDSKDIYQHWVYAGVVIPQMTIAIRALFRALRDHTTTEFKASLRINFLGTSYATAGNQSKIIELLASDYGLQEIVQELPDRMPYSQTLACLNSADALMVIGSDDPGYTASKIYPYLLARKPLLAIFHEESSIVPLLSSVGGGVCVSFRSEETEKSIAQRLANAWLANNQYKLTQPFNLDLFEPYTAKFMTEQICHFFNSLI